MSERCPPDLSAYDCAYRCYAARTREEASMCQLRYGALVVLLMLAWAGRAEAQSEYRMLVNHGAGWSEAGDFRTLDECTREAVLYAAKNSAQAGCASVFQQAAAECGRLAKVEIIFKPDRKLTILGMEKGRFAFDKCMAERGQPIEKR